LRHTGLSAKGWRTVADWRTRQPATETETALEAAPVGLARRARPAYEDRPARARAA